MSTEYGIIDAWMQHPNMNFSNHSMFESLRRWTGQQLLTEELPVELTVAAMDQAGVSRGLLCAWWSPSGPLISNEEVAAHVKKYPSRFIGVAAVDLYKPMDGIRELRRCVKKLGFKALRIVQWLWGLPPTDRRYYPLYAECIELDIPVCLQVGHTGPLRPSETGRPIPYIDEVAIEFPELKMVCGHIGYPWTLEMVAVATKHENVYIDTSAYVSKRYPPELVNYMKKAGSKKVLFGTNYPMITADACLKDLGAFALGEEVKKLFLHDNAARVFKL
ncbi:MAG: amidohydrolase family protein [Dehalococcoidia bacterium]|nr:amidohydrolase family protein [Dehalococcoidia bacterium]MDD5494046.1 amidohydrolase family protein [Dehalococcoidia bacterium]